MKLPIEVNKDEEGAITPLQKETENAEGQVHSDDQAAKDEDMDAPADAEEKEDGADQVSQDKGNVDPQGQKQPLPETAEANGTEKKKQRVLKASASCPTPPTSS